ncbi:hypothetical protein ACK8N7_17560 [Streptomyces griseobrunneus]
MPDNAKLADFFGDAFVSYIANHDSVADSKDLGDFSTAVLATLDHICMSTAYQEPYLRWANVAANVMRLTNRQGMSLANHLRQSNGGKLFHVEGSNDELLDKLLRVASDIYPAFLVKRPEAEPLSATLACGGEFLSHPDGLSFTVGLLGDPDTSALFPNQEPLADKAPAEQGREITDVQSFLVTSSGGVQILRLHSIGEHILNSAFHRLVTANSDVSQAQFLREASSVLSDIRRLGRGESIDITVVVGLAQLGIDCDEIVLGDERALRRRFSYSNTGSGAPWNPIVLTLARSYRIHEVKSVIYSDGEFNYLDAQPYADQVREWHSDIEVVTDRCCLSLYMASDVARPSGIVPAFTAVLEPFTHYPIEPWRSRPQPNVAGISLSQTTAIEASAWYVRFRDSHPANLNTAIRRMVSACNSRYTPSDSLLDAVLAWENMFSGTPETVLRVCGAMACLLAPGQYEERSALYSEIKQIYNARSQIVHGKSKRALTESRIQAHADKAIEYAFRSMKELYKHPDVLALRDSDARGLAVLLGATQGKEKLSSL